MGKELVATLLARREIDPVTHCWLYNGRITRSGYGCYGRRANILIHRVSAWHFGLMTSLDSAAMVSHSCNNRRCFNPDHFVIRQPRSALIRKTHGRSAAPELTKDNLKSFCHITQSGCWKWLGACDGHGYGVIIYKSRRSFRVPRLVASLFGLLSSLDIPLEVMHKCDNPPCCNPDHLRIGSHLENMRDMFAKGRRMAAVGERASKAKLTEQQVLEIRHLFKTTSLSERAVAARFGVGRTSVRMIRIGKHWKHLPLDA